MSSVVDYSNRLSGGSFLSDIDSETNDDFQYDANDISDWYLPIVLHDKRHREKILGSRKTHHAWRMKERMKTVSLALVLCLNVGVDPPDVLKIQPCAREECWTDPLPMGPKKALEVIGAELQKQYEKWQPRARAKLSLDPTLDEVKKLCQSLRRNAKEERVLFHYNGHGVPRPTDNGEIWVFNKNYTQYIPLSLYTLHSWMGMPSIYVFDCSNAGLILEKFADFQQQRDNKIESMSSSTGSLSSDSCRQCILLGACSPTELLPQDPNLPADLFTSCLTTPVRMALRWYVLQNSGKLVKGITKELVDNVPGELSDRRTMLGELNWIFTAITDTIAWNVLPRDTFQKLFRQDLLVASLFRNYLLAERIMRTYNCTPVTNQRLPPTYQHPMWQAWDFTLDSCLSQLRSINGNQAEFQYSTFFAEQLTAFQVWLDYGTFNRSPPEQLPIVLQVLLSQVHRLRALELLSRFLDHGSNAVSLALSVGIFPYVLKLLQSAARELRPLLVFIWAKILSVDGSCQTDLVKDAGHKYFIGVLEDKDMPAEYKTMAAFVLAMIVADYPVGQETVFQGKALSTCLYHLEYKTDHRLRQWSALCIGRIWQNYSAAKWSGVRDNAHEKLYKQLADDQPEVRCAALFALSTFISQSENKADIPVHVDHAVGMKMCSMSTDPCPMVREELLIAMAGFISLNESPFINIAYQHLEEENSVNHAGLLSQVFQNAVFGFSEKEMMTRVGSPKSSGGVPKSNPSSPFGSGTSVNNPTGFGSSDSLDEKFSYHSTQSSLKRVASSSTVAGITNVFNLMWKTLLQLAMDPFPAVNQKAGVIVNYLKNKAASNNYRPLSTSVQMGISRSISVASSPLTKASRDVPVVGSSSSSRPFSPSSEKSDTSLSRQTSTPNLPNSPPSAQWNGHQSIIDTTEFFKWSCKMFEESAMADLYVQGSSQDLLLQQERKFLYEYNVKVKQSALEEHMRAPYTPLETEVFVNKTSSLPLLLRFHPYDVRLAVADNESVAIWDWEAGVKVNQFYNHTSRTCKISSLEFLNSHDKDKSLIAVATDDGALRIWNDFNLKNQELNLITAWQAIPEPATSKISAASPGVIMEWQQSTSCMYFSGAHRFIRLFDVNKEIKVIDMPTGTDASVTSLCSDSLDKNKIVASCSDGSIRIFDKRLPPHESRISSFQHGTWVINCQMLKGSEGGLISAGNNGEIKFWDMRRSECVGSFLVGSRLKAMVLHRQADLIACGMAEQMISIFNTTGDTTSTIKYHEGFMGQRVAKVNCLAFHPHLVRLASGNVDGMVSVYSLSDKTR